MSTLEIAVLEQGRPLPAEVTEPITQVLRWLLWLVFVAFVARLIWVAGRFAYQRHHALHDGGPAVDVAITLAATVVVTAASGIAAALLSF